LCSSHGASSQVETSTGKKLEVPKKVSGIATAAARALAAVNADLGIDEDDEDVMERWFAGNKSMGGESRHSLPWRQGLLASVHVQVLQLQLQVCT
jgi:hypothetical protein